MPSAVAEPPPTQTKSPPTTWPSLLRQLGPGLIISASIVGSGELIVTPKLGASVGFTLLWFIILGCVIKVFVQIELGRFAISKGLTTLEALDLVPGPRAQVSWLVWLWLGMYVAQIFQFAGMIGGVASIFALAGVPWPRPLLAVLVGAVTALLLAGGRYRTVQTTSTWMVVVFTVCTLVAVAALQQTPYAVRLEQIRQGLSFNLPSSFTIAFAAFGIIGVGASELIYYPYWCLEKGYARHVGAADDSPGWVHRARGWIRVMHIDAWVSLLIYTTATLAFYLLGAAVLHAQKLDVGNDRMIETLSRLYRDSFGEWSYWLFLLGACNVLYSTIFVSAASHARLLADAATVFGVKNYAAPGERVRVVRLLCVVLPLAYTGVYLVWEAPVSLVLVGALAQALMLPFLAGAAVYFHFRHVHAELRTGALWTTLLWLSALMIGGVGAYQVAEQVQRFFR
jgi:Mn2+/Fe2+ NRAMP family transporter